MVPEGQRQLRIEPELASHAVASTQVTALLMSKIE